MNGELDADGGGLDPSGSGGAIRLVANSVIGAGLLHAAPSLWGNGYGRIRVEGYTIDLTDNGVPQWTSSEPGLIFPGPDAPTLRVVSVDSIPVPADPLAGITTSDVEIATDQPVTLHIEGTNIPAGTGVSVLIVPDHGTTRIVVGSTPLVDIGGGVLTATCTTTLPPGKNEIQLRANWTP